MHAAPGNPIIFFQNANLSQLWFDLAAYKTFFVKTCSSFSISRLN